MDDDRPRLDQLNIVVSDMEASVAFYRRLGLTIDDPSGEWASWASRHRSAVEPGGVEVDFDSTEFAREWDRGWRGGPGCVIGFRVSKRETVDRLYADLTGAGYHGQQEPWDASWGARYAIVEDPDGNAVGIMSGVDPAMRRPSA
jgi:catechol 2,3-dioxygenase-like lactoylglutathione lyase family enzyme